MAGFFVTGDYARGYLTSPPVNIEQGSMPENLDRFVALDVEIASRSPLTVCAIRYGKNRAF